LVTLADLVAQVLLLAPQATVIVLIAETPIDNRPHGDPPMTTDPTPQFSPHLDEP
jgi:hypothetical protein